MGIHVHIHTEDNAEFESKHPRKSNGEFGSGKGSDPVVQRQNKQMAAAKHHAPQPKADLKKSVKKAVKASKPAKKSDREHLEDALARKRKLVAEAKARGDRVSTRLHEYEASILAKELAEMVKKGEHEIEREHDPKKRK
jgi:hypothetical protein